MHVVRLGSIIRKNIKNFRYITGRIFGFLAVEPGFIIRTKFIHQISHGVQTLFIILHLIIGNTANFGMCGCTAQCLVIYIFAYGCFHQIASRQKYTARSIYNQGFIAHNRQISTTGHTAAHDSRYLWDPLGT